MRFNSAPPRALPSHRNMACKTAPPQWSRPFSVPRDEGIDAGPSGMRRPQMAIDPDSSRDVRPRPNQKMPQGGEGLTMRIWVCLHS